MASNGPSDAASPLRTSLPTHGRSAAATLGEMFQRKASDAEWLKGRTFSLVYPTGRADVDAILLEANVAYMFENALNPLKFPSLATMQREVVNMTSSLVNAPSSSGAGFSSGGTESIFLSVLVARERARVERGIGHGNIVFPESAHPAFAKAAFYTGLEARATSLSEDFTADLAALEAAVDENTVLIIGSAYGNPHGVVDPIEAMSNFALDRGIAFHSDTCIGAFVLPFLERLGIEVPPFDFRLPGVTQMSCDVHKYGYSTKGASVIVYRDAAWLQHQVFDYDVWPSGRYRTASVAGARAASPIAAAWSLMTYLGEDGYLDIMRGLVTTVATMKDGISALPGLRILGNPIGPLLTFTSDTDDIFAIADVMDDHGWHLNRIGSPNGLHMMISPLHGLYAEEFLTDLASAVANHGPSRGIGPGYNGR
ncbi:MAG: aminotransferase class V-fold PLP-dependent enzyme [Actinomycetota bacterium]